MQYADMESFRILYHLIKEFQIFYFYSVLLQTFEQIKISFLDKSYSVYVRNCYQTTDCKAPG